MTVLLAVVLFTAAQVDAGPNPCDPVCTNATTLAFCDNGAPATLDCTTVGGACKLLTPEWGEDCVLPQGADCDPGYAFGASRCDRTELLFCVGGTCTPGTGPKSEGVEEPTPGTEIPLQAGSTNPFGCPDCGSGQAALLLPALVLLRGLRGLRRSRTEG